MFKIGISDTQCGFKAVNQRVVDNIIPLIENNNWFFDTELLLIAKHKRYKIGEIPVKWIEDNDSKVVLLNTVIEDIMGLLRMRKFTVNLDERK